MRRQILILSLLIVYLAFFCFGVIAQDEHTIALYDFETGNGKIVKDLSDKGNDGKFEGKKLHWGRGKFGGGLVFGGNATRDHVIVPDSESLWVKDGLTVEVWVFLNFWSTAGGTGVTKESSYKAGPQSARRIVFRMTTNEKDWGNAAVTSSTDIPLKSWHHLAATYDAKTGQAKVYLDGRPDGKGRIGGTIKANNDVLWLGRGQGPFLDGRMDEVRISNIARTEEEIKTLMEKGIESMLAISPKSKLAISWGYLKTKP
ncbi:TPA: LamG domain-containing protein [Candidatus Poribacteria bacterium]|nr:LamG domain-containing protein [Candidatus Poribacteria bacterium]HIO46904.1 LamG domain-containing protein [Candidatus Poribacteria bacterium]